MFICLFFLCTRSYLKLWDFEDIRDKIEDTEWTFHIISSLMAGMST